MSRETFERMTKRIIEHNKKTGGKMTEREAREIASSVAIRHDRKNSGK
jgi:hypothetical protein|tara:strand:+ start:1833 stop:1976 length:144 start_codon:yes stop_codon:yes gene_type:complete